ncbi:hypothetical protein [Silvibacterium acidisoli]|uniref:hypothetical protein n=1 Tax=Acidobacteriaceae bacterium ZG23-2 TaxID=2883246 RepID=UPI00406C8D9B
MTLAAPNSTTSTESSDARTDDPRWLLAERVAESPGFARSPRLAQLLLYLCHHHLIGNGSRLSELTIATDVFGRGRDFDSANDTIVRSHMLRLRQKLEAYFREEGAQEELQISIPRGRYVPSFQVGQPLAEVAEAAAVIPPVENDVEIEPAAKPRNLPRMYLAAGLLLCLLGIVGFIGWRVFSESHPQGPATRQLWKQLFPPHSTTLLVAADSGLVLLHGITGENTTLGEYTTHDLHRAAAEAQGMKPETALSLAGRRYTSFVDLELFDRLTHLPEALSGSYSIRYARDLNINELKDANVIFSGSEDANPWIETYESGMNFVLEDNLRVGQRGFANRNPKAGEPSKFITGRAEYGVLAFLANPSGHGSALIIEGTSVAGTESASDFLFNSSELESFLDSIRRPNGSLPHFEIIFSTQSLDGSASPSKMVSWRVHDR